MVKYLISNNYIKLMIVNKFKFKGSPVAVNLVGSSVTSISATTTVYYSYS
jgi:hypothetical protein